MVVLGDLTKKYGAKITAPTSTINAGLKSSSPYQSVFSKYGATVSAPITPTEPSAFQGTKDVVSDLISDPLSLKANPKKAVSSAWEALKGAVMNEAENIKNVFTGPVPTGAGFAGQQLKVLSGAAGVVFSPISALFAGAEQIPVLGSVAKLINIPFTAVGEGGAKIGGGIIDQLPISDEAKAQLKPGVEEIFALAGQLALGKVASMAKKTDLIKKYGEKDANTIIEQATKLAEQKKAELNPTFEQVATKYGAKITKPTKPIKTPTEEPLITEAKKYKSAEEFVNSQPTIYHGTPEKFTKFDTSKSEGNATWFTADKKEILSGKSGAVQGAGQKMNIMERYIKPDLKLATPEMADNLYTDQLIAEGYRGVKYPAYEGQPEWTKLFNPNEDTITKSQLTDIWNKAQEKPIEGKVSGIAREIEAKAIEQGMKEQGFEELAGYDASTIKAQSELGSQYSIEQHKEFMRTGNLPEGMKPGTPIAMLEKLADTTKDIELHRELAKSPLLTKISEGMSAGSLSRMREKGGTVENIRKVERAREEHFKEATKTELKNAKEAVKRIKPTKDAWLEFVDEIKCR